MYLPLLSTRGRGSPRLDAAALETRRRASPLPGAHVVADIRGAAPGNSGPRCGVWVETSRDQATKKKKKNFARRHSWHLTVVLLGNSSGVRFCERGDLCAWTQLESLNSAPRVPSAVFQQTPAHCFVEIFSRHLLGFFRHCSRLSARPETLRWLVHLRESYSENMDTYR